MSTKFFMPGISLCGLLQDRFGDHGMDALDVINGLRHVQIAGEAAQGISFVLRNAGQCDYPVDHLAQRLFGGVVQIPIESERDQVSGRLGARQLPVKILSYIEFESALERGLDGGAVHFAVALSSMAVASRE